MYRPITMYQIVCDRCGEVFGGTDTCSALFCNKEVDIGDYSDWEMIDGKHYCPDCNEDEVDYNELNGVTFSTEKIGVTDCDTENVPYVNAASLWHDLKEEKPPLKKWVMFRYSGGGVNPTALHYGAMSDDIWVVTRGDGTQRIEVLYECYDKIEWLDFDELK